jgi:hypothetical protein
MQSNSYVLYLQGLYAAMFKDIAEKCPHLRVDSERDYSRLLSIVEKVGLRFYLIDLPSMGKHFDRCLSEGLLTRSDLPYSRSIKKSSPVPRLFKGLWLSVFDESGVLRVDPDVQAITFLRQLLYAAKKFRIACSDSVTWKHVNEFFEVDRECLPDSLGWKYDDISLDGLDNLDLLDCHPSRLPSLPLLRDEARSPPISERLVESVQRTADIVAAILGRFDPVEWDARHGPGAVSDQRRDRSKYDFPNWPEKLDRVFPFSDHGFHSHTEWANFWSERDGCLATFLDNEAPSKLISVPKELKGPRLIAAEPVSHQWCQQIILDFLVSSLKRLPISDSIHFRDQTENGSFALRASHSQSHVTVDLSSASDRISCWAVERFFRRNSSLVSALHASRTRFIMNAIDRKSPKYYMLRKFSTMGSAVTFPIQSYMFTIMAIGSLLFSRGLPVSIKNIRKLSKEVRVFGDDIIIPEDGWTSLQATLEYLRLKVNRNKTFETGKFRESCGVDAYDGHDVTKVSILSTPDVSRPGSVMSSVDVHNNFLKKGYVRTAEYIKSTVDRIGRFAIPIVTIGSGAFGWYSHLGIDVRHLKRRWNSNLQRVEVQATTVFPGLVRTPASGRSMLLQYFTEAVLPPVSHEERLGIASIPTIKLRRRWVAPCYFS